MKLFVLLIFFVVNIMCGYAQIHPRTFTPSHGGGLVPINNMQHAAAYPRSLPNYMPPEFVIDRIHNFNRASGRSVFQANGWRGGFTQRQFQRHEFNHKYTIFRTELRDVWSVIFWEPDICFFYYRNYLMLRAAARNLDNTLPEGYVVYKTDTVRGYITIDNKDVYVQQPVAAGKYVYYSYRTNNSSLKCVVLYNTEDKSMELVRLNNNDKRLWRVVHRGKVTVYDDKIGFIYEAKDIDKDNVVIIYNDEVEKMRTVFGFDVKQTLIDDINRAYGYQLDPKNYTWQQTLEFIDALD